MGRWLNTHKNGESTKLWKEGVTITTWEGGALGGEGGRKEKCWGCTTTTCSQSGGAHLLFQQELTSEELELAQQGGAWLLHWRKECLSQVAREKVKGESERRKWKSSIILSSFLILWFHYFGPVLEKVSGDMKVLANSKYKSNSDKCSLWTAVETKTKSIWVLNIE